MILTPHVIVGATIASRIPGAPIPIVIVLAYLSHFVLDALPHWEYPVVELKERKSPRGFVRDLGKVGLDLFTGFLLIFIFSQRGVTNVTLGKNVITDPHLGIMLLAGIFAALPDAVTFLGWQTKNPFLIFINRIHGPIQFGHWGPNKINPQKVGLLVELITVLGGFFLMGTS